VSARTITVLGAGILGLWQAYTLARRGNRVTLLEAGEEPFIAGASRYGAVMLAPEREAETAPAILRELGHQGIALWREAYPDLICNGSIVVAAARDRAELERFALRTRGHALLDAKEVESLEPDLEGRFAAALFFADEAHMPAPAALDLMLAEIRNAGVDVRFGARDAPSGTDVVIDCRGLAARDQLPDLRGVRGERLLLRSREIDLSRPVQLLHPRQSIYLVPWGGGIYMIGATVIETEDAGPMTVRSALDLLSAAYAVHPAFGEAEIIEQGAGVRPAFPDNVPRAIVRGGGSLILVNGAYRHGFLLAPVLAANVAAYLDRSEVSGLLRIES
jgi:glycine oxidase